MELSGKRVVVVGGTSGIGRAVAEAAANLGASVIVGSSSAARVEAARANGTQAHAIDVKDEAHVAAFFETVGAFDHLVYTAGDWGPRGAGPIENLDLGRADEAFTVRFWGAVKAVKHAHPRMNPNGSITLTDGMVAHRPRKTAALATAMAGAIEHLVRGLAVELAPRLRVNGVCPGYIATDIWNDMPPDRRAAFLKSTERFLVPRAGGPAEAAAAYIYLMGAGYTTGQVLFVEGGMSLT